jgi:hypothetical protein
LLDPVVPLRCGQFRLGSPGSSQNGITQSAPS